jgi:hypothetical protein
MAQLKEIRFVIGLESSRKAESRENRIFGKQEGIAADRVKFTDVQQCGRPSGNGYLHQVDRLHSPDTGSGGWDRSRKRSRIAVRPMIANAEHARRQLENLYDR